jgi:hypothetical protein
MLTYDSPKPKSVPKKRKRGKVKVEARVVEEVEEEVVVESTL